MDNYSKAIPISLKIDNIKDIGKDFTTSFIGGLSEELLSHKTKKIFSDLGENFGKGLGDIAVETTKQLISLVKDSWQELENLTSFSRLSQSGTRELAFRYGFSGSQAYGFSKASQLLGLDEEGLMYASVEEQKLFRDAFTKYTEKYNSLYDKGFFDDYLKFQVEMEEFKEDLKLEVIQFFIGNKDLIKDGMVSLIQLSEFTVKALSSIISLLTMGSERSAYSRLTSAQGIVSKNVNVSIDNTFNNVNKSNQEMLTSAGEMAVNKIVKVLEEAV